MLDTILNKTIDISIHAPAKGATRVLIARESIQIFQSTLPQRERPTRLGARITGRIFQSTLPQRERPFGGAVDMDCIFISIHAPAKGATGASDGEFNPYTISIHAPAKGATDLTPKQKAFADISIHAPAKGATAIFHKIMNYYCETPPNNTQINPLNFNAKYINKIKISVLSCFFLVRITQ